MVKKLVILIIPLVLLSGHLAQQFHLWHQAKKEINQTKTEIANLEKENRALAKKITYYQSDDFVRREAREKLGMTGKNELIFLIPPLPDLSSLKMRGEKYEQLSVWKQWWQLFFTN